MTRQLPMASAKPSNPDTRCESLSEIITSAPMVPDLPTPLSVTGFPAILGSLMAASGFFW